MAVKLTAKQLIHRAHLMWDRYYEKPTKLNLKRFGEHLERMKESAAKSVKAERARGLRAYNREVKAHGWAPAKKKRTTATRRRRKNPADVISMSQFRARNRPFDFAESYEDLEGHDIRIYKGVVNGRVWEVRVEEAPTYKALTFAPRPKKSERRGTIPMFWIFTALAANKGHFPKSFSDEDLLEMALEEVRKFDEEGADVYSLSERKRQVFRQMNPGSKPRVRRRSRR